MDTRLPRHLLKIPTQQASPVTKQIDEAGRFRVRCESETKAAEGSFCKEVVIAIRQQEASEVFCDPLKRFKRIR
jgi:hypothetical protein